MAQKMIPCVLVVTCNQSKRIETACVGVKLRVQSQSSSPVPDLPHNALVRVNYPERDMSSLSLASNHDFEQIPVRQGRLSFILITMHEWKEQADR